jgi:hypothetical protein
LLGIRQLRFTTTHRPVNFGLLPANPKRHPIAIALRRQDDVDDARVTKSETLVRRGKKWFRYDAPGKQLFKQLQKTLKT